MVEWRVCGRRVCRSRCRLGKVTAPVFATLYGPDYPETLHITSQLATALMDQGHHTKQPRRSTGELWRDVGPRWVASNGAKLGNLGQPIWQIGTGNLDSQFAHVSLCQQPGRGAFQGRPLRQRPGASLAGSGGPGVGVGPPHVGIPQQPGKFTKHARLLGRGLGLPTMRCPQRRSGSASWHLYMGHCCPVQGAIGALAATVVPAS